MAGLPGAVSATLNNHVLTFLNRSTKIDLAPLKLIDVSTYYEQQFKTLKINITNDKCKELAEETEGSPYLMQLLGHYITLKCNDNGTISKSAIDEAIKSAKEDYIRDICQTIINTLSDKDIEFLKAMNADETKISDIINRMGVSNAYAQLYKKRLIDSGVIEQVKRGTVTFAVAYLYDYLNEYL
jgi:predicted transcriptional regulator